MRPNTPREVAAWYPNAVALAALILSQVREVDLAGGMTLDIAARGVERLRAEVIGGLIPGGAWNPYRRAVINHAPDATIEAEIASSDPGFVELTLRGVARRVRQWSWQHTT